MRREDIDLFLGGLSPSPLYEGDVPGWRERKVEKKQNMGLNNRRSKRKERKIMKRRRAR